MKPKKKPAGAINIHVPGPHGPIPEGKDMQPVQPVQPMNPYHCPTCQCAMCKGMYPKYK
jgi:hypothetical protein